MGVVMFFFLTLSVPANNRHAYKITNEQHVVHFYIT